MSDYGAHATSIPTSKPQRKPRKDRPLPANFVKRPAEEMAEEYGELIEEVEASLAEARAFLAAST